MLQYSANIIWQRKESEIFTDNCYSREHAWQFDGGQNIQASSSPHVVPLPFSVEQAIDPEEAFIASLSSCHMLWFLSIAAKAGYRVNCYTDHAQGVMRKVEGKLLMTDVYLSPLVDFSEHSPNQSDLAKLHHDAHLNCFIANSVKSQIHIKSTTLEEGQYSV